MIPPAGFVRCAWFITRSAKPYAPQASEENTWSLCARHRATRPIESHATGDIPVIPQVVFQQPTVDRAGAAIRRSEETVKHWRQEHSNLLLCDQTGVSGRGENQR